MKMNFTLWLCVMYMGFLARAYIINSELQIIIFVLMTGLAFVLGMEEALEDRERRIKAAMRRHPAGGRGNL